MARTFVEANKHYLRYVGNPITTPPYTMAAWVYPTTNSDNDFDIMNFADEADGNNYTRLIHSETVDSGVQGRVAVYVNPNGGGGASGIPESTAAMSYNAWNHATGYVAGASDRGAYLNGANKGTNTATFSATEANWDSLSIGCEMDSSTPWDGWDGSIAECVVWDVQLNDDEISALGGKNGTAPGWPVFGIRPNSIVFYAPLRGIGYTGSGTSGQTLTTLRPNGNGTISSVITNEAGGAADYTDVEDDPDSSSTDGLQNDTSESSGTANVQLTATNSDFGSMDTLGVRVDVHAISAGGNDSIDLYAQVFSADNGGGTALTDEVQVGSKADTTRTQRTVSFTAGSLTGSKTDWDGAYLRLRWNYTKPGGPDNNQLRIYGVEMDGTYTTAAPSFDDEYEWITGSLLGNTTGGPVTGTSGTATRGKHGAPQVMSIPIPAIGAAAGSTARTVNGTLATLTLAAVNSVVNATRNATQPTTISLGITEQSATVKLNKAFNTALATLTAAAQNATVNATRTVAGTLATLSTATLAATVQYGKAVAATLATLTATSNQGTVALDKTVDGTLATLTLAALNGSAFLEKNVNTAVAALTIAAAQAVVNKERGVDATVAGLTVSPLNATLDSNLTVNANLASLTISGLQAVVALDKNVDTALATLAATEGTAVVKLDKTVAASLAALGITTHVAVVDTGGGGPPVVGILDSRRAMLTLIGRGGRRQ